MHDVRCCSKAILCSKFWEIIAIFLFAFHYKETQNPSKAKPGQEKGHILPNSHYANKIEYCNVYDK